MRHLAGSLMTLALLAAPAVAPAQDSASQAAGRPRAEVGAGGSWFYSGGTMPYTTGLIDTRVGVKLTEGWSVDSIQSTRRIPRPGTSPEDGSRTVSWIIERSRCSCSTAAGR